METKTCRGCGRPIVWAISHKTGSRVPVDPEPVENGNILLQRDPSLPVAHYATKSERAAGLDLYISHFATCPKAASFRHGNRKSQVP